MGFIQGVIGFVEMIVPYWSYDAWKNWVKNKFFPIHGILLIAAGLPLTIYKGYMSGVLFFIGLFIVFTGPLVLIYPDKIRNAFLTAESEISREGLKRMIYFDSAMRLVFCAILLLSYYRTWGSS